MTPLSLGDLSQSTTLCLGITTDWLRRILALGTSSLSRLLLIALLVLPVDKRTIWRLPTACVALRQVRLRVSFQGCRALAVLIFVLPPFISPKPWREVMIVTAS